jgi:hypothetical protein
MAPTAATRSRSDKAAAAAQPATTEDEQPTAAAEEKAPKGETLQQLKNRLRNEAEREVLNTHKDEVIKITGAKYEAHGLEYVRRLTDEEKAAKQIEEYYRQFPNLRPATVVQADPDRGQQGADERGVPPYVEARESE